MCLLHSENKVHLETKLLKHQTRSWKKKAIVFTTVTIIVNQDQQNAGFSKVCEVYSIDSEPLLQLNYI